MAWLRPTPQEIRDRVGSSIAAAVEGADPRIRRSVEAALVRGFSIAAHELHGHVEWVFKQRFVATADGEYLERHGLECRPAVTRRAALRAEGPVTFTGLAGTIVPANTELRRSDDARFVLLADAIIGGGGSVSSDVRALLAYEGKIGNTDPGMALSLIVPIDNVQSNATVAAAGLTGGTDLETDDSLRARIFERKQAPAVGGNDDDYKRWVSDVVGATKVWVYPNHLGLGTVGVAFIMPDGSAPDPVTLTAVRAYIALKKPAPAVVTVLELVLDLLDFEIKLTPDTALARVWVELELREFFIREAAPGGTSPTSRISAAISAAAGQYSHEVIDPAGDVISPAGHIARLGAIGWVA